MKIGILTYHRSYNYGAFLQAYSLSHALNNMDGIDCELINYNLKSEDEVYKKFSFKKLLYIFKYKKQEKMFQSCQAFQLLSDKLIIDDDYHSTLKEANKKYDVIVTGSDEIWRIASRGFPNIYWLPGKYDFAKMSYAASGRNPKSKLTDEVSNQMKSLYEEYRYIGVRDGITYSQIKDVDNKLDVYRNCDPAFLYSRYNPNKENLRNSICEKYKLNPKKKIICVIYDRINVISKLKKKLGKNYSFVCLTRPMINANKNLTDVSPFEWVDLLGGCDFAITSAFHGMIFAINQDTPVIAIDRRANRNNLETSKLFDFLSYSKMEDRYYIASELDDNKWDEIAQRIKHEIEDKTDFSSIREEQLKLFEGFRTKLLEIKNEREK